MSILKPYHRIYRPVTGTQANAGYSSWKYITDPDYAFAPTSYIKAFLLILADLQKLFEYIEPAKESMETFSFRIHELFMRTCIEVEANFKAILTENIYTPALDRNNKPIFNIRVYKLVNKTHKLSEYKVGLPQFAGNELLIFEPFKAWQKQKGNLAWYTAYNESKHNRHDKFKYANLENLLNAIAGLLVLVSSQFRTQTFSAGSSGMAYSDGDYYAMSSSIGSVFRIQFPEISDKDKYDFDWAVLKNEEVRFQKFNFDSIK
ncbi:MAG: hypothetical protein PF517_10430 [Salinivirgaceae bacterium]|nr:hypothetical protein [Salinivirgaceae bacterium]